MNNKRERATKAASALRQSSRGSRARGQMRTGGRRENTHRCVPGAQGMHQPSHTQQNGTRPSRGHPSTTPQQTAPTPAPVMPALQPLGQQDPQKANPSLHTRPRAWPLRVAPLPASDTQGGCWRYQEAAGTKRTSGTPATPREGPVHQLQAAKGWGVLRRAPPTALRLLGHPNLHPWGRALLLPHKAEITSILALPSILAHAQPGHPMAPRGTTLTYHLKARKLPAAGGKEAAGPIKQTPADQEKKR